MSTKQVSACGAMPQAGMKRTVGADVFETVRNISYVIYVFCITSVFKYYCAFSGLSAMAR